MAYVVKCYFLMLLDPSPRVCRTARNWIPQGIKHKGKSTNYDMDNYFTETDHQSDVIDIFVTLMPVISNHFRLNGETTTFLWNMYCFHKLVIVNFRFCYYKIWLRVCNKAITLKGTMSGLTFQIMVGLVKQKHFLKLFFFTWIRRISTQSDHKSEITILRFRYASSIIIIQ